MVSKTVDDFRVEVDNRYSATIWEGDNRWSRTRIDGEIPFVTCNISNVKNVQGSLILS